MLVLKKSELWKHLEFVHSKDKSHNCSNCELSFSKIDILKRHANYFHEDRMSQNMLKLWLWFFWKNQFERADWTSSYKRKIEQQLSIIEPILKKWNVKHLEFVHSKDRSNNCSICEFSFSTIDILKDMPIIFMRTGCQKTC